MCAVVTAHARDELNIDVGELAKPGQVGPQNAMPGTHII